MRAPRLALTGGITLAIAITPVLAATVLAADPTVVVQPGDTLTGISQRHGVSVRRLTDLNRLSNPNRIFAGQRLRIGRDRSGPGPSRASVPRARARATVHVVTPGSTLWGIGQRYRVSVNAIVAANRIADPSRIFAGQRLVIPGASTPRHTGSRSPRASASAPRPRARIVHVVTQGSTLSHIAVRYGVSLSSIAGVNRIADPSRIFVGQRLVIPSSNAAASPSARPARTASRPRMSASMASLVARRSWMRGNLVRAADQYGVPRSLVLALAWQESGWQQHVVSHAGAVGVMQLMPGTARWVGEVLLGHRVRISHARSNIDAGVRLLRHYLHRYDGNLDRVLAAYYQGHGAVDTHGIYPVSRPYIASIRYLKRIFGG